MSRQKGFILQASQRSQAHPQQVEPSFSLIMYPAVCSEWELSSYSVGVYTSC